MGTIPTESGLLRGTQNIAYGQKMINLANQASAASTSIFDPGTLTKALALKVDGDVEITGNLTVTGGKFTVGSWSGPAMSISANSVSPLVDVALLMKSLEQYL